MKAFVILLSLTVLNCGGKKEKKVEESTSIKLEELYVKQEIKVLETVTEEIKNTAISIEESLEKLEEMLNEL